MEERDCKHGQLARSCNICELQAELDYAKTTNWYQDVKAFHKKFGCYIGTKPGFPSPEVTKLRSDLFLEECKELTEAMKKDDIVETADAFADLIYVTIGWALACGIPLDKVWEEVQKSNMLKEGGGTRADGKILKPAGWVPPDIESALFKCTICQDKGYLMEVGISFGMDHHPSCTGTCEQCPVPVPEQVMEQVQCPCGQ